VPVILLLACLSLLAANLRLYLKDGGYHLVREYQVQGDRVRFYSVERSEWEEIPLDLVDLKRTEADVKERADAIEKDTKVFDEADQEERRQREEVTHVPQNPGVYLIDGANLIPIKQAEAKIVTNKTRRILQVFSPLPVFPGQTTVELDGAHSASLAKSPQPEFYFRMELPERFGIFRLTPKKDSRVVQTWNIVPKTNEILEVQEEVPVFRRQMEDNLYKIWPTAPLKPGEYAVVEYTAGQQNIQIWDFAFSAPAK
jgi:hypothetical protein